MVHAALNAGRTRSGWVLGVALLAGLGLSGCLGGGGGGGNRDGGVVPIGGTDGGGGAGGEGGMGGMGGAGGEGGGMCTPACEGKTCGPDGCGGVCGTCDAEAGLRCISGACSDEACPQGTLECTGVCAEVLTDADNCGNCGNACARAPGLVTECLAAECYLTCPTLSGQGVNVDLQNDPNNCGACNNRCPSIDGNPAVCNSGVCEDPCLSQGQVGCGDRCVDTSFDTDHCGRCGNVCPTAEGGFPVCEGGTCGDPCNGQDICGGACTDTFNSNEHCGGCNNRCTAGTTCQGGTCACEDGPTDLLTNVENCGRCGNACPALEGGNRECAAGRCADACGGELNECNGSCVNLTTDADNCGACDNACASYATREPPVRDFLNETDVTVTDLDCTAGNCLKTVQKSFGFPSTGQALTSCNEICAQAGMACHGAGIQFASCPGLGGLPVPFAQRAAGCVVYQGIVMGTPSALGCADEPAPTSGLSGDDRLTVTCGCEAVNPIAPAPPLGPQIPGPGSYNLDGALVNEQILVAVYVPDEQQDLQIVWSAPGYAGIYDADGNELDRNSNFNNGPFASAVLAQGETYYFTFLSTRNGPTNNLGFQVQVF